MRIRPALLGLIALATASCGGAEAAVLAYGFQPGEQLTYRYEAEVDLEADIDSEGVPHREMGDLPRSVVASASLLGDTGYQVEEGSEPDTVRLTIDQQVDELTIDELVVDGESIDQEVPPELEQMFDAFIPELTLVVDRHGEVISAQADGEALPGSMFGEDRFSSEVMSGGPGLSSLLGPQFPEEPLGVGDSWTTEETEQVPPFDAEITIRGEHRVTGEDQIDGRRVLVIETTVETSGVSLDLTDLLTDLKQPGATEGEPDFGFSFDSQPAAITSTIWFDPANGQVVRSRSGGELAARFTVEPPEQEGGGMLRVNLRLTQTIRHDLQEPSAA